MKNPLKRVKILFIWKKIEKINDETEKPPRERKREKEKKKKIAKLETKQTKN